MKVNNLWAMSALLGLGGTGANPGRTRYSHRRGRVIGSSPASPTKKRKRKQTAKSKRRNR